MSKKTYCLAVVLTISTTVAALAGGRGCRFDADGLRLMKDQPVFGELLQSKLSIVDNGQMGPDDSPWDDVIGRMYSFMEFRATATGDAKQKFLVRVHFTRVEKAIFFKSVEVLPVLTPVRDVPPVTK